MEHVTVNKVLTRLTLSSYKLWTTIHLESTEREIRSPLQQGQLTTAAALVYILVDIFNIKPRPSKPEGPIPNIFNLSLFQIRFLIELMVALDFFYLDKEKVK